jgi:NAD(P)-dependent dehydrogenase (short-subunit alcohol dehydrogenase family)
MLPLMQKSTAPRIVNVSSGAGSLALAVTRGSKYLNALCLTYNSSKAALNCVTLQFAAEFRDTAFKINSVNPGYTASAMLAQYGNFGGRPPEISCEPIVRMAMLGADGPTGGFFDEHDTLPW